jgi:hypothetical protein
MPWSAQASRVVWRSLIGSSARQRTGKFFPSSAAAFSRKRHLWHRSCAVLSLLGSIWLLAVSRIRRVRWKQCDSRTLKTLGKNVQDYKTVLNNVRSAGNIVKKWKLIVSKYSRLLMLVALKFFKLLYWIDWWMLHGLRFEGFRSARM